MLCGAIPSRTGPWKVQISSQCARAILQVRESLQPCFKPFQFQCTRWGMMSSAKLQTKRYASENDLFVFSLFCLMIQKTGNTGAEKLLGRTYPTMHGVYPLHWLLEDGSTKSYEEEKTHRISTNNIEQVSG